MTDAASDQLAWEQRRRPVAAGAAVLAALLFVAGNIYLSLAVGQQPRGIGQQLAVLDRESTDYLIAALLLAGAYLLLGVTLAFLYRAVKHRRSQLPTAAFALTVFGAIVAPAAAVLTQVAAQDIAAEFLASGPRTVARANDLRRDSTALQVVSGLGFAANLALGTAMVFICLNALRTGLLSRFMGGLGVGIGILLAVPLIGKPLVPLLFLFWLSALAALLLDRWPGGRGPAWETGQATPWPTMAEQNAELERRRGALDRGRKPEGTTEEDREEYAGSDGPPATTSPDVRSSNGASKSSSRAKRKRGRRR
ncbi:MAG: hypothetical protein H0U12_10845 [Thermoleophilaceae bacterium]|jgi:hypothetical protein|nr:hypothetical protein [Thermoleophilaceae bacterium]